MTPWLSGNGWGSREQAIPGEWATLILLVTLGGALGFAVLWFTMRRHERAVLARTRGDDVAGTDDVAANEGIPGVLGFGDADEGAEAGDAADAAEPGEADNADAADAETEAGEIAEPEHAGPGHAEPEPEHAEPADAASG